jgi:hypothetical protein
LNEIYGGGQQKARRKEIENYLGDGLDFVTHINNRIRAYLAFGKEFRKYLAEQRAAHPELEQELDALDGLAREIDRRVGPVEALTGPERAAELNRQFIARGLLDYEGADWQAKLKQEYTDPLTRIGGAQDEKVGECRWVVKALRQKAGILLATDPRMAGVAAEIRTRTHTMLRGGAAYEGARH